ncbi:unnamed protein product [Polarella glacialis]|uniref:SnoaL-like domain-containing protein n=1 Tax=Polarella glacialis TaxID=89957 RepID=A0A813FTC2_POLGL|nr:unnamed protein product [Polarella glacialis]
MGGALAATTPGLTVGSHGSAGSVAFASWQQGPRPAAQLTTSDSLSRQRGGRAGRGFSADEPKASSNVCALAAAAAAAITVASRGPSRSSRRRAHVIQQCSSVQEDQAASLIVAAALTGEKKSRVLLSPQRRLQNLFELEINKSSFSENAWYESPDNPGITGQKRVKEFWDSRPTRIIERICDGKDSCGCTWKQMDGRRGVSFFRFNEAGQMTLAREILEPAGFSKFKTNNMQSLSPAFAVMNVAKKVFGFVPDWFEIDINKENQRPLYGLQFPKTRSAPDVVRYLWEEAYCAEEGAVDKIMEQYSEDAVFEDLTYVEEVFAKGWDEVSKYQKETKENAPENLRFVLDEVTKGQKSCACLWHVEFNGNKSPRGVSFYELNDEGKVCYVRASYDLSF